MERSRVGRGASAAMAQHRPSDRVGFLHRMGRTPTSPREPIVSRPGGPDHRWVSLRCPSATAIENRTHVGARHESVPWHLAESFGNATTSTAILGHNRHAGRVHVMLALDRLITRPGQEVPSSPRSQLAPESSRGRHDAIAVFLPRPRNAVVEKLLLNPRCEAVQR